MLEVPTLADPQHEDEESETDRVPRESNVVDDVLPIVFDKLA